MTPRAARAAGGAGNGAGLAQIVRSPLELDGYLTGVIVAPQTAPIRLHKWIAGLWSEAGNTSAAALSTNPSTRPADAVSASLTPYAFDIGARRQWRRGDERAGRANSPSETTSSIGMAATYQRRCGHVGQPDEYMRSSPIG
jgi:hypothetical protein